MKKIHRRILENQEEIMNALEYLMMPERPKRKHYQLVEARGYIRKARIETGKLLEQDNIKRYRKNPAIKAEKERKKCE